MEPAFVETGAINSEQARNAGPRRRL